MASVSLRIATEAAGRPAAIIQREVYTSE